MSCDARLGDLHAGKSPGNVEFHLLGITGKKRTKNVVGLLLKFITGWCGVCVCVCVG